MDGSVGDFRWTKSNMEADFSAAYMNALQKIRPEGFDRDPTGFGTLLFWGTGK